MNYHPLKKHPGLGFASLITLLFMGFTLGIGSIGVARAATPVIDQSFTSPTNAGSAINSCCKFIAQTFTAGLTGVLTGVNIEVLSSSADPLHVAIRTVTEDGTPGSTILGETDLSSGSAPLSLLITFPQTIQVVAGQRYAVVVHYEGVPPGMAQGTWQGAGSNLYSGGGAFASVSDGLTWSSTSNFDWHFQTYVDVEAAPGVSMDIRPNLYPNIVNLNDDLCENSDSLPVAVLTTPAFNALTVKVSTLQLGDPNLIGTAKPQHNSARDVDGDGDEDLLLSFSLCRLVNVGALDAASTELVLIGQTSDRVSFSAMDSVQVILDH